MFVETNGTHCVIILDNENHVQTPVNLIFERSRLGTLESLYKKGWLVISASRPESEFCCSFIEQAVCLNRGWGVGGSARIRTIFAGDCAGILRSTLYSGVNAGTFAPWLAL